MGHFKFALRTKFYWSIFDIQNYIHFHVYNVVIWHLYTLQNDHNKSRCHLPPHCIPHVIYYNPMTYFINGMKYFWKQKKGQDCFPLFIIFIFLLLSKLNCYLINKSILQVTIRASKPQERTRDKINTSTAG